MAGKKVFTRRDDTFFIPGSEETPLTAHTSIVPQAIDEPVVAVLQGSSSHLNIVEVSIDDILDGDYQTRDEERVGMGEEKFQRLVSSMKKHRPDEPLLVRQHPVEQGKWQLVRGGHSRRDAAKAAGYTTYLVRVVEYDNLQSALGSAWENLARQDLTVLEEGELYRRIRQDFGYTQEELAKELGISRDRIKDCEALLNYGQPVRQMLVMIKRIGGNPERGLRAAKILHRIENADHILPQQSEKLIPPLADAFATEQVTTDELEYAVRQLLAATNPMVELEHLLRSIRQKGEATAEDTSPGSANRKRETPPINIQRANNLQLVTKRFHSFVNLIGDVPPSPDERRTLQQLRQEIDRLLTE